MNVKSIFGIVGDTLAGIVGVLGSLVTVGILSQCSHLIHKALSKKIHMKFLPKVSFIGDRSFDYAEKIEKLIQKNKQIC